MLDKNREKLLKEIKNNHKFKTCKWKEFVCMVLDIIFDKDIHCENGMIIDLKLHKITEIDDGGYSGTCIYLIPFINAYPNAAEYFMTYVEYGSCPVCDTLKGIQELQQTSPLFVTDMYKLALDVLQNLKKPYNTGCFEIKECEENGVVK